MTLTRPLRNGHYWVYLAHGMIVSPIVSIVTFTLTTVWLSVSLGGLTYWFWGAFLPTGDGAGEWGSYVSAELPGLRRLVELDVEVVLYLIAGIVFAITLPWCWAASPGCTTSSPVACSAAGAPTISRPRCGPRRPRAAPPCRPRTQRSDASSATSTTDRSSASCACRWTSPRSSAARPPGIRMPKPQLAREAQVHAKSALDELRALSAGFAPPILQDRGLAAALGGCGRGQRPAGRRGRRSRVDTAVSPEIERNAYFVAAELLTNAVKHAGASAATLKAARAARRRRRARDARRLGRRQRPRGSASSDRARTRRAARARRGLRGMLVIDSPPGGPTTVGAHIPLAIGRHRRAAAYPGRMSGPYRLPAAGTLRVVLAEDSVLLREGLVRLFDEAGYETAGSFGDADDSSLERRTRWRTSPCSTCGCRRRSATRACAPRSGSARSCPSVGILLLSQYVEGVYAHELLAAGEGGVGYLLKDRVASLDELTDAVHRVARAARCSTRWSCASCSRRGDPLAALTPREREVLELMAEGRTNAGIAERLFIGVGAVEKNVTAIFQKLGLEDSGTDHRRVLAVLAWLQRG